MFKHNKRALNPESDFPRNFLMTNKKNKGTLIAQFQVTDANFQNKNMSES